jgi:hypothetical protein
MAGIEARVWPTLAVILVELPNASSAQVDQETGLALIDPGV